MPQGADIGDISSDQDTLDGEQSGPGGIESGVDRASGPPKAQTPKSPDDSGPRDLRPTLLGGLTALIAALTAVATVNGAVARMFRNHPWYTSIAIVLVLVAFLCGLLSQIGPLPNAKARARHRSLLVLGSVALVVGMGAGLIAQVKTAALGDRPIITATTQSRGSNVVFEAEVKTEGARAHDQLIVVIFGEESDGARTAPIYYAKTGPDENGDLIQSINIEVNPGKTPGLYLSAVVVPEGIFPHLVDCDGNEVQPSGQELLVRGKTVPFHTPGNPLVACLILTLP